MSQQATLSFTINSSVKKKAKENLEKQGFDFNAFVGSVVNELLHTFAEKKATDREIVLHIKQPTTYFKKTVEKARKDLQAGNASPTFDNPKDAIDWLHK